MQSTDHDKSKYDRVTNKWRCGGSAEGAPCMEGPDGRGRCPYSKADKLPRRLCQPITKNGHLQCGLSDLDGGPCVQGPGVDGRCCEVLTTCTPILSERQKRSRWVWLLLSAVIGVFALFSSGSWLAGFISPGPTDHRHAMIEQCETCHTKNQSEFTMLLQASIEGMLGDGHQDADACISCHQIADFPHLPHNADPQLLIDVSKQLTKQLTAQSVSTDVVQAMPVSELSCATCHEIHDSDGVASRLSDQQCQSCHVQQFESLQHGHPEFTQLPDVTPQVIFDHHRHQQQHFDKKSLADLAPEQCTDCHLSSQANDMRMAGFDGMCSGCHLNEDITTKLIDKIGPTTVFAVPNIDAEAVGVGYWPNCRTTQFKRINNMPVLMKRLLETDENAVLAMQVLADNGVAMNSLDDVSNEVRQAIVTLTESIRSLAADIAADDALERFSQQSENRVIRNDQIAQMISAIPVDVRRLLHTAWFQNQPISTDDQGLGICPTRDEWSTMRAGVEKGRDVVRNNSGWYMQAKSSYMALSYIPKEHADATMKLLSSVAADDPEWHDPKSGFQCSKCHLVNSESDQTVVAWPSVVENRKTRFSHPVHLTSGLACATCHQLVESKDEELFASSDHRFIEKSQCVDCHQTGKVEQSCSDCHDYHWEAMSINQLSAPDWDVDVDSESEPKSREQ